MEELRPDTERETKELVGGRRHVPAPVPSNDSHMSKPGHARLTLLVKEP